MRKIFVVILLSITFDSACAKEYTSLIDKCFTKLQSQENQLIHRLENFNIECEIEIIKLTPRCFYEVINPAYKIHVSDKDLRVFFENFCKGQNSFFWLNVVKKLFHTKYDWVVNVMLYSHFGYNDLPLVEFLPNDIVGWRVKQKINDYFRWIEFFENIDVTKLNCNCYVNDCYEHYGYDLTHKEPWGELYRRYRVVYKSVGYNFVLYAYKKHVPMNDFHPHGQFYERYKKTKTYQQPQKP